ncbi:MAG: CDP-paratose 2-epimerase [Candidatus Eremiobacteraeota bacterium]|jgi:CDP-paratose 2-epimerase|nr:CDP-paratose 2-epimerase [Candidatus Eremiobacteraeota bacterium]MEA2718872.1 CDP-paratose 2-epimerase [Candidatus Eremiobacteraeota bacterium]
MSVIIVTGSAGLIGSEAVAYFAERGHEIVGIDNNFRQRFFGAEASTEWNRVQLEARFPKQYTHVAADIRDADVMDGVFARYGARIALVVHTAAQPSHDWAATDPQMDFTVNANGTLAVLEATRKHAPGAVFIFTSTNKVYGDAPNELPLIEGETRWEIDRAHPYWEGIDENLRIDQSKHSLFGASKVAADVLVQEYGRYFSMPTAVFRGGCLTGPNHSGTKLHGFLAYLLKCTVTGEPYQVFGYKGKQVRDNIHAHDLVSAFDQVFEAPRCGEVYNAGGTRFSNCSMIEAIALCEEISGRKLDWTYTESNRIGDHIWYISDMAKFRAHYPGWKQQYDLRSLTREMYDKNVERWLAESDTQRAGV